MSFPCEDPNCAREFKTKAQKNKHTHDDHTLQVTIFIQNISYTVDKSSSGFICPKCSIILKSTSTFKAHAERHNKTTKTKKNQREENFDISPPKSKLPRTYSESEIKIAQSLSNETKTLTKPMATLAAVGGLNLSLEDQQKTMIFIDLANLTPIALLSEPRSYYLLGNATDVQKLHEEQPKTVFSIPPDPSPQQKNHNTDNNLLSFLINNSSMAPLLKDENYVELDTNYLQKANRDWQVNPESRYAVSQLFAGCILMEGTKAIIVNCVEPYGRKKVVDPHYERYSREDTDSSIPDFSYRYKGACVKLFQSDSSSKLVIGLFSCNLLVTSSCTLSTCPLVCVGPSTTGFAPSKSTKIYLHERSVEMADKLFNKKGCSQLYPYDILSQCKQVRSKFYRVETYSSCRSSSVYTLGHLYQPYTIWTLYDYDSAQTTDSQAKLASLLFQKIAIIVLESTQNRVEPYMEKKTLEDFCGKGRELANTIEEILKLFGKNDRIKIIDNKDLDIHLQAIAQLMSSSLRTANETVKERLVKKFS